MPRCHECPVKTCDARSGVSAQCPREHIPGRLPVRPKPARAAAASRGASIRGRQGVHEERRLQEPTPGPGPPRSSPTARAVGGRTPFRELLEEEDADVVFVAGFEDNQSVFHPRFDSIILLSAPITTIVQRVIMQTTNPYGTV